MSKKIRKNQTIIDEFIKSPIGLKELPIVEIEKEEILNFPYPIPMEEFIKSPIGIINGEQINLKHFEISKSAGIEYRKLRNEIIYKLNKMNLRYSEIAKLKVQDIDNSFFLIRIKRGNRVFRIAISKEISEKLKVLTKYKDDKDYVFTKDLISNEKLSETMITKIIKKYSLKEINTTEKDTKVSKEKYIIEKVCDKYVIYQGGRVIEGLLINNMINAIRICEILNAD